MIISLSKLDNIIYDSLRPWLDENKIEDKYYTLLDEVNVVEPSFQPLYAFAFYRPIDIKTQYYEKIIINSANEYCNKLIELIKEDGNEKIQKYQLGDILKKKLPKRFAEISKIIKERQYDIQLINPKTSNFGMDENHKTETYIIQLLKTAYLKIYLEIQDQFKSLIPKINLMEYIPDDIYIRFLKEAVPNDIFLKQAPQIINIESEQPKSQKVISTTDQLSFKYKHLNTHASNINDLHNSLIKNELISKATTLNEFKKAFSGSGISEQIVWIGNNSEFYYFINLICVKHKLMGDLKQRQWEIACNCFVDANGTLFDKDKVRKLKKPQSTSSKIETSVNLLKV